MRVILLGPQGAGKGTQAQRLERITGAKHVSTGDLVRGEITAGTPLGLKMRSYNDQGALVPDRVILEMVINHLAAISSWILDGFPRTLAQATALDDMLAAHDVRIDRVLALEAPDDLVIERLSGRRQSRATGLIYHLVNNPPPASDPGPFVQREDDDPANIRRRLRIYHEETEPLKTFYAERGLLTTVDARLPVDEVTQEMLEALHAEPERA